MRSLIRWVQGQTKLLSGVAAGIVIGLGGAAIVSASIPDTNGIIHGCIRNNGDLRIIDSAAQNCTGTQDPITFNQTGPQGPAGPQGAAGTGGIHFVGSLANVDLGTVSWMYFDLGGLDFHGSTFAGSMVGSSLVGANLANTHFTSIAMDNADVHGVNLSGSTFSVAFAARNTNFSGANFTNATISSGDAMNRVFLTDANFSGANFTSTQFVPYVTSGKINGGNFSNAQFVNANMAGVNFVDATFTNATWNNTICPDGTNSNNNGNTCNGHFTLP